jgi:transposase
MPSLINTSFTAFVGIDWADSKHDVCLQVAGESTRQFSRIDHTPESIERWALALHHAYGAPIAVAVELTKGPLVSALQKYDFIVLFPINPTTLAKYRKAFVPSGAKDDPSDAQWALELLMTHPEKFPALSLQSSEMRILGSLTEQRRQLVEDRVRVSNRLCSTLKQYYPLALELFKDHGTLVFADFLRRWPSLDELSRARPASLDKFLDSHNVRRSALSQKRQELILKAKPLTEDHSIIAPSRLYTLALADQLKVMLASIKSFDIEIETLANSMADYKIFHTLPGAGKQLAPRLMVAFGDQRDRFNAADEVQKYAGVAPVTERSGKKQWVHWRWQCSVFLRQTFVEWAGQSVRRSAWAGEFYRQQRAKGSTYQVAIRALAFKWIRILYRCWKTSTVYEEQIYLKALSRHGSPLSERLAELAAD